MLPGFLQMVRYMGIIILRSAPPHLPAPLRTEKDADAAVRQPPIDDAHARPYNYFMTATFRFLIGAFVIICAARPVARLLRIPAFTVYILAGVLLGPSVFDLATNKESLNFFYDVGVMLLMFSAGLELKLHVIRKHRKALSLLYVFDALIPGAAGLVLGLLIHRICGLGDPLFLPLFMITLFAASAVEVLIPLFRESAGRMSTRLKAFSGVLVTSSVLANTTSLFVFSGTITFHAMRDTSNLATLIGFSVLFVFLVIRGIPLLQEKVLKRILGPGTSSDDETRILIMLLLLVVAVGAGLHIHSMVCAFLAGISLANTHIGRRVLHNFDFITTGIFMPFVFIVVGTHIDLALFRQGNYALYPVILTAAMIVVRSGCIYVASRLSGVPPRLALGFGASGISQMTGTIATAVVARQTGILPDVLFDSIVLLCIITTIIGPVAARALIFPGGRRREGDVQTGEDFTHFDIRPLPLLTPLSGILRRVRDTELSVYPVVDERDIYRGVLHLEDVKNLLLGDELDMLVIGADLLDPEYPSVSRHAPLKEMLDVFRKPDIHAIPVIEESEEGGIYIGMILLKDLLPQSSEPL
jgi:Kef-type K+ transport system membrane component KefB/CBS domain-containing protein